MSENVELSETQTEELMMLGSSANLLVTKEVLTYLKMRSDSALRVTMHMTGRASYNQANKCHRWYVLFDDQECSSPASIEMMETSESATQYLQTMDIDGTCYGLASGTITIKLNHEPCDGYGASNSNTGHLSSRSVVVYEITTPEEVSESKRIAESHVLVYSTGTIHRSYLGNIQQFYWWNPQWLSDNAILLSISYTKEYADTGLKLSTHGNHRVAPDSTNSGCGRWFFEIDNAECSDPGTIEGVLDPQLASSYYIPLHVSGICHNVGIGSHTIQYSVGRCQGQSMDTDATTGWASSFTIVVEEVRVEELQTSCSGRPVTCS
ncbi:CTHRC1 [Bugula neritina]|uniref:CTHRC1 n=1 Tax=Bugula neritina TaxID=10212 RepID=A0A7J7JLE4_BUGNE|nr:CTHRC1 [Bugula neritina]